MWDREMLPRHEEIANAIFRGDEGKSYPILRSDLDSIYTLLVQLSEGKPILSALRVDGLVMLEFPELSKTRLIIDFGEEVPKRSMFANFDPQLEYNDATPKKAGFRARLWKEVSDNKSLLLVGLIVFWALMWRYGTPDGWSNLFNAAAQVVSIFVAVFLVFATVQRGATPNLIAMFTAGELEEYHSTDVFLVSLAVLSVFTTLGGTFAAKYEDKAPLVTASLGWVDISVTGLSLVLGVIGTLLIVELVILFVSLPQYYLKRARKMLFADLQRATLDKRYEDVQREMGKE